MNILLVGATSPIGQNLNLVLSDDHHVFTANRTKGDLIWDLRDVDQHLTMGTISADVIINLAANYGGATSEQMIDAEIVNVIGALRICDLAIKSNVKHVIFISSIFSLLKEDSVHFGIYPLSKRHSEEIVKLFCANSNLSVTILQPSQIYGDDDRFRKNQPFLYKIIDQVLLGEDINIDGSNDPKRNYLHVDDLVAIISKVVDGRVTGSYTCQYPTDISYSEIANAASMLLNSKSKLNFNTNRPDVPDRIFDRDSELFEKIKFQPRVSMREGLARIINKR